MLRTLVGSHHCHPRVIVLPYPGDGWPAMGGKAVVVEQGGCAATVFQEHWSRLAFGLQLPETGGMQENPTSRRLAPQRQDAILTRIETNGAILVTDIAQQFGVSSETARRDLKALALRGAVELTHGGAVRASAVEPALASRSTRNTEAKARIGRRAATLVTDGMVVLLDAGSTTAAIAAMLGKRRGLTVITTSLAIARDLCRHDSFRIQITGGTINPGDEAAEGPEVMASLARFRVDIAFVSAGGVAMDGSVTDFTPLGAETRGLMIAAAHRGYFVLDASKFGARTPCRIIGQDRAAGLITDSAPPATIARALEARNLPVLSG